MFRTALRETLTAWLGRTVINAEMLPRADREDAAALRRRTEEAKALIAEWIADDRGPSQSEDIRRVRPTLHRDGGDQKRLATFAAGVLSYLPRSEFLPCYVAWASSRAIAGDGGSSAIDWTLRVNGVDPDRGCSTVLEESVKLTGSKVAIVKAAGTRLLEALATPMAGEIAASLGVEPYAPRPIRGVIVSEDGVVSLEPVSSPRQLDDFALLQADALLPDQVLAPSDLAALETAADAFDVSDHLAAGMSRSHADLVFAQSEAVLARWAPGKLGSIIRRTYDTATLRMARTAVGDNDRELSVAGLAKALPKFWPVLGEGGLRALQPVVAAFLSRTFEVERQADDWLHLQIPRLLDRSAAEQIEILANDPQGPTFFESDRGVLAPPVASDYVRLAELLAGPHGVHWLGYMLMVDRGAMPSDFAALQAHVGSADLLARKRALQLIRSSPGNRSQRCLVDSGWSWNDRMDPDEGALGSLALLRAISSSHVPDLGGRVDPEVWGAILAANPDDRAALERFMQRLVEGIRSQRFPGSSSDRRHWLDQDDAVRIAAARCGDRLVSALDELIGDEPQNAFAFDSHPVVDVLMALCRSAPAEGARIWNALWQPYLASSWTLTRYEHVPFAGDAEILRPLWDRLLDTALSDAHVEHVVAGALDSGRENWLLERVESLLSGPSAGEVAKGLTVARFLDPSPGASVVWRRIDAMTLSNWLSRIRSAARREYGLGRTAERAAASFVSGMDADQALADLVLLKHAADARAFRGMRSSIRDHGVELRGAPRAFWPEWCERLKASSRKNSEGRDKRYLLEDPPKATHRPWRT